MKTNFLRMGILISSLVSITNASANYKRIISNINEPTSMTLDNRLNNILVSNKCTIYTYDLKGTKLKEFGSCSSEKNTTTFNSISMIQKDNSGNLIVIENNKIEKFDKDNKLIFSKKIDTSTDNIDVMSIVVDSNDNILIAAYQNNDNKNYIYRFDSSGQYLNKIDIDNIKYDIPKPPVAKNQQQTVNIMIGKPGRIKIAIDKNDNLLVLREIFYGEGEYIYTYYKIDKEFNKKSIIKIPYLDYFLKRHYGSKIEYITYDKNNFLYIGIMNLYETGIDEPSIPPFIIFKFDNNYNIVSEFDFKAGDGEKQLYNISKISVDNDGFFILDKYNNKVLQTTIDKSDLDNDGIKNSDEDDLGTNPNSIDSDKDLIFDNIEIGNDIYNPKDTDGDGIIDALDTDSDNDGVSDYNENLDYKRNPYINENLLIDYRVFLSNTGDFDNDQKDDILTLNVVYGKIYTMLSSNNFKLNKIAKDDISLSYSGTLEYNILDTTDLNGDGLSDLIIYDKYKDKIKTLIVKNKGKDSKINDIYDLNFETNVERNIIGKGDFTGDKKEDLLISESPIDENKKYLYVLSFGKDGAKKIITKINKNLYGFKVLKVDDFNGDNISDILLQREADGNLYTLIINQDNIKTSKLYKIANKLKNWSIIDTGYFNDDKSKDILLRREDDGNIYSLTLDNNGTSATLNKIANHLNRGKWSIIGVGRFNNDNIDDILAYRVSDGNLYSIIVNKNNSLGKFNKLANDLKSSEWKILTIADFNGDGISDILAHRYSNGDLFIIDGKDSKIYKIANNLLEKAWSIQKVADYNGDGAKDILIYRKLDGDLFILNSNKTKTLRALEKIANNLNIYEWVIERIIPDIYFRRYFLK